MWCTRLYAVFCRVFVRLCVEIWLHIISSLSPVLPFAESAFKPRFSCSTRNSQMWYNGLSTSGLLSLSCAADQWRHSVCFKWLRLSTSCRKDCWKLHIYNRLIYITAVVRFVWFSIALHIYVKMCARIMFTGGSNRETAQVRYIYYARSGRCNNNQNRSIISMMCSY